MHDPTQLNPDETPAVPPPSEEDLRLAAKALDACQDGPYERTAAFLLLLAPRMGMFQAMMKS